MRRFLTFFALLSMMAALWGCAGNPLPTPVQVTVTNPISMIQIGEAPVTLMATVDHDKHNAGVTWALNLAGVNCSPGCGALAPAPAPSLMAVYTPPATAPLNQTATITVTSVAQTSQFFAFNISIVPAVVVTITDKFMSIVAGGAPVTVDATVANDSADAGVAWTLTAGGSACSPACGTITPNPAPSFSAVYTPPTAVPTGANLSPTITATSVTQSSQNDSFTFMIGSAVADFSGTYTFLLRGFDRLVLAELGLDRYPELWADYFGHYRRLVWLAQDPTPALAAEAERVAGMFGLPLTRVGTGVTRLESALAGLVEDSL